MLRQTQSLKLLKIYKELEQPLVDMVLDLTLWHILMLKIMIGI